MWAEAELGSRGGKKGVEVGLRVVNERESKVKVGEEGLSPDGLSSGIKKEKVGEAEQEKPENEDEEEEEMVKVGRGC